MFKAFWSKFKSFFSRTAKQDTRQSAASAEFFTAIVYSIDDILNLKGWMYYIPFKKISTRPLVDEDLELPPGFYPADGIPPEMMGGKVPRTLWQLKDENGTIIARIATLELHNERIWRIVKMRYPDAVIHPKTKVDHGQKAI